MKIIGITGGVACGKTAVAGLFQKLGAVVLDADRAGHAALLREDVKQAATERWGERILAPDGQVDRKKLGEIVFAADPEGERERRYLESLSHPHIAETLQAELKEHAARGAAIAVVDAALLFEAGWDRLCDATIFVEATREIRRQRAGQRGWDQHDFARREAAQLPPEEKRRRADLVIDNSGSLEQTAELVEACWAEIVKKS